LVPSVITLGGQALVAVLFYFVVVKKYAAVEAPTEVSSAHMRKNPVSETCDACCQSVCWMSYCCPVARWALTLHATNTLNYWVAVLLSVIGSPCCLYQLTMCYPIAFTDLNEKLGGTRTDCCEACLCALCCSCCVNVKYALALDFATNQRVGCFSVSADAREIGREFLS